ncbi:hypothetical protein FQA39_LY11826 [Lamprigera yunnana]|nr:hypothetical protein FQA39_LY11826 [Lamprigera yunnana]
MNSKSIKVRDGVKIFLDKAKSLSVPLHLGAITTFDTDSCKNNMIEEGETKQSIDLHWSIPEDYDANNEARLLAYGNAAEETLINSTRYDLDNEIKYIEIRYGTNLDLQPVIRIRDGATACTDSRCNARCSKNKRDYRTCKFNRYDVESIFHLKSFINYRLEIMRSSGFKEFYDNIVECVIIQKSKREEIRRMIDVNVDDFQVYDDGGVYEIFDQLLNSKYNINSYRDINND